MVLPEITKSDCSGKMPVGPRSSPSNPLKPWKMNTPEQFEDWLCEISTREALTSNRRTPTSQLMNSLIEAVSLDRSRSLEIRSLLNECDEDDVETLNFPVTDLK